MRRFFVFALSVPIFVLGEWTITSVGNPGQYIVGLSLGVGRNDNTFRVYGLACGAYTVGEFTFSGGTWIYSDTITLPLYGERMALGKGRNDGLNRLYVGGFYGSPGSGMEFTYTGNDWQYTDMGASGQQLIEVIVGSGRNDDTNRVYFACGSTPPQVAAREYSYRGSWVIDAIGSSHGGFGTDIGPGRNDGVNRIFKSQSNNINEYTWTNGQWVSTPVGSVPTQPMKILVGKGRNDDTNRVYVLSRYSGIFEYTYQNNNWVNTATITVGAHNFNMAIGNGQNDGKVRLYVANYTPPEVYEVSYESNNWVVRNIGTPGGSLLYGIILGPGRNGSSKNFVYVGTRDGGIYEFEYKTSVAEGSGRETVKKSELKITPNPTAKGCRIEFISRVGSYLNVDIYDLQGSLVRRLAGNLPAESHITLTWDGKDENGRAVKSGVYFVRVKDCIRGGLRVEKIVVAK